MHTYVYIYIYTHTYTYTCIYIYIYTCIPGLPSGVFGQQAKLGRPTTMNIRSCYVMVCDVMLSYVNYIVLYYILV